MAEGTKGPETCRTIARHSSGEGVLPRSRPTPTLPQSCPKVTGGLRPEFVNVGPSPGSRRSRCWGGWSSRARPSNSPWNRWTAVGIYSADTRSKECCSSNGGEWRRRRLHRARSRARPNLKHTTDLGRPFATLACPKASPGPQQVHRFRRKPVRGKLDGRARPKLSPHTMRVTPGGKIKFRIIFGQLRSPPGSLGVSFRSNVWAT